MIDRVTYVCGDTPVHVYRTDMGAWRVDYGLTVYLYAREDAAHARARRILSDHVEEVRNGDR